MTIIVGNTTIRMNSGSSIQDPPGNAPSYLCRAWVNFDGTAESSPFTIVNGGIRAAGNVASVTDNGTGDYTINFTTALVDSNYSVAGSISGNYGVRSAGYIGFATTGSPFSEVAPAAGSFRFTTLDATGSLFDPKYVEISVFR